MVDRGLALSTNSRPGHCACCSKGSTPGSTVCRGGGLGGGARAPSAWTQALLHPLQVILIISGNLSFLNWLTMVPSVACFDDATLGFLFPSGPGGLKYRVLKMQEEAARGALAPLRYGEWTPQAGTEASFPQDQDRPPISEFWPRNKGLWAGPLPGLL